MTEFYDSASGHFPHGATHVMLPADGQFAVSHDFAAQFEHVRWYTVLGNPDAGGADFEAGDGVFTQPGKLRDWVAARHKAGKRARVYCSLSNVRRAMAECKGLPHLWWLATLDGKRWTADELAARLKADYGAILDPARIWAVQYEGGIHADYDTSILLNGEW